MKWLLCYFSLFFSGGTERDVCYLRTNGTDFVDSLNENTLSQEDEEVFISKRRRRWVIAARTAGYRGIPLLVPDTPESGLIRWHNNTKQRTI